MFKKLIKSIGGNPTDRDLQRYTEIAERIDSLQDEYEALTEAELRAKTDALRQRLADATAGLANAEARREAEERVLDEILVEAFATVRAASVQTIGLRHYSVQLVGGQVLHAGRIAEMRTGEGKTLVATLPLYLNALTGRGAHLVTVNDYLARRDAKWMAPIFHVLGMKVGILQDASRTENARKAFIYDPDRESSQEDTRHMRLVSRAEAYAAEITYGTNNEFGFDYLRDHMAIRLADRRQRELQYAIIDEVDNVLIDGARTPLIISGPAQQDPKMYYEAAKVAKQLRAEHFEIDERGRSISLTEEGFDRVEEVLGQPLRDPDRPEDITPEQAQLLALLEQALRAEFIFKRNKDYLVQGGRVIIVDEFTGRVMPGRRWSDGLHQAVEAKESVKVQRENVTYATITLQNFFRLYTKLAGMSGTAVTEAEEFHKIYELDVVPIPTNLDYVTEQDPHLIEVEFRENGAKFTYIAHHDNTELPLLHRRKDYDDLVYRSEEAKSRALTRDVLTRHVVGQPLLIGTTSVESSERLSGRLRAEPLRKLALIWLLRDTWFEANDRVEDGRAVPELAHLNAPLDTIKPSDMRPLARDLGLRLNPTDPENLNRLAAILDLAPADVERLKEVLEGGVQHQVLNAKKHDEESKIIASAGELGAVTIATNMAGRGVDIKLGGELPEETLNTVNRVLRRVGWEDPFSLTNAERLAALAQIEPSQYGIYGAEVEAFQTHMANEQRVREAGGLHVVGSERHEARRIDNQLRGRASRQGDPGSSRFYLSLEDDLMRRFGGANVAGLMERLNIDDIMPIEHGIVNKSIEQSQTRVEGANFDVRKHLLEYDDVLNTQRSKFYEQRNRIFTKEDLSEDIDEMLQGEVERRVDLASVDDLGWWKLLAWLDTTQPTQVQLNGTLFFPFSIELLLEELGRTVPALGEAWQAQEAAAQAQQAAGENPNTAELAAEAARALAAAVSQTAAAFEQLPAIRDGLLEVARRSAAAARDRLLVSVAQQLEGLAAQAPERAAARRELAEMAYEGAEIEAREYDRTLQPRNVAKDMIEAAGVPLTLTKSDLQDLTVDNLRAEVGRRVEAAAGAEIVRKALGFLEARTKLTLDGEPPAWESLDWDSFSDTVLDRLEAAHVARTENHLTEIQRILDDRLGRPEHLTHNALGRLILDMAYSRDVSFHKKTHRRQERLQQRFPYVYYAAELLEGVDPEALTQRLLAHLREAQRIREQGWGEAELQRLSTARIADLDAETSAGLQAALRDDYAAVAQQSLGALNGELRSRVRGELGRQLTLGLYRQLLLSVHDQLWVDYLTTIEGVRTSVGLEAYAQRDPLTAYKSHAYDLFQNLLVEVRAGVVSRLFTWQPHRLREIGADVEREVSQAAERSQTLGRNDPCWCGSGKKYKSCHMRSDQAGTQPAAQQPAGQKAGGKKKKRKKKKQRQRI